MRFLGRLTVCIIPILLAGSPAGAASKLTLHGKILKPDNTPVNSASVSFQIQIRSPGVENCLLYQETQTLNLSANPGVFNLSIGSGARPAATVDGGFTLNQIFQNRSVMDLSAAAGACTNPATSYTPGADDQRNISIQFNDGSGWQSVTAQKINPVPRALDSGKVGGYDSAQLLRVADGVPTAQTELSGAQWTELLAVISGTSTVYSKPNQLNGVNLPALSNGQTMVWNAGAWTAVTPQALPGGGANGQVLTSDGAGGATWTAAGTNASSLTSGTLSDARLSSNVALKNASNTFSIGNQNITNGAPTEVNLILKGAAAQSANLLEVRNSANTLLYSVETSGTPVANTDLSNKAYVDSTTSTLGANYVRKDGTTALTGNWAAGNFDITGIKDIGATGYFNQTGMAAPALSAAGEGRIYFDSVAGKFKVSQSGGAYADLVGAGGGGTTITINSVVYGAGAQTNNCGTYVQSTCSGQGSCSYVGSNGNCGGDPAPAQLKIITVNYSCGSTPASQVSNENVVANLSCTPFVNGGNSYGGTATIGTTDNFGLSFITNNSIRATISASGDLGIGTTAPAAKMEISGEIKVGESGLACSAATKGSIRYNNTTSVLEFCNGTAWNLVQAAACSDPTPDAIVFSNEANATTSTLYASDIKQVNGINCSVPVQISGQGSPQFQICSDSGCSSVVQGWTTGPSSITNGQYLQTRLTTDTVGGAMFQSTIIVGSGATVWSVTNAGGDCTGSPSIGTVCSDGTVYAGLTPDGSVKMFTTRCDFGQTWDGTICTGSRSTLQWNNGTGNWITTGYGSTATGKLNSAGIAALVDAASPYIAAQACENLNINGKTDWYLPAMAELNVMYSNKGAIRNFELVGGSSYWTSTESSSSQAGIERFTDGWQDYGYTKVIGYLVRCVRR